MRIWKLDRAAAPGRTRAEAVLAAAESSARERLGEHVRGLGDDLSRAVAQGGVLRRHPCTAAVAATVIVAAAVPILGCVLRDRKALRGAGALIGLLGFPASLRGRIAAPDPAQSRRKGGAKP